MFAICWVFSNNEDEAVLRGKARVLFHSSTGLCESLYEALPCSACCPPVCCRGHAIDIFLFRRLSVCSSW